METPVTFQSGDLRLHGLLHEPALPVTTGNANDTGVVFLHGWSGSRIGPHRMFVTLARRLCEAGFPCLRFDFAGRGDSEGAASDASIASMIEDTLAAGTYLADRTGCRRLILIGICSGAKVAVGATVRHPERTAGLVLLSHELMGDLRRGKSTDAHKSASALKAYLVKLTQPATWRKIFTGRVNTRMVGKALVRHERPGEDELVVEARWLERFRDYKGRVLFVYGGNDPTAQAARPIYETAAARWSCRTRFHLVEQANHSFYSLAWEQEVMATIEQWLTAENGARA